MHISFQRHRNVVYNMVVDFEEEHTMMTSLKWKHFPCYWPFARGIHRSPVNSPHKGQWRGALIFSLICVRINGWWFGTLSRPLWRHCNALQQLQITKKWESIMSPAFRLSAHCTKWCNMQNVDPDLYWHIASLDHNEVTAALCTAICIAHFFL